MNRACKTAERRAVRLTNPAPQSAGVAGPKTFDGRDNKGSKPTTQVDKKLSTGKSLIAGRVP